MGNGLHDSTHSTESTDFAYYAYSAYDTHYAYCAYAYYAYRAYQATFLRAMDWRGVHELLIDAAVLRKTDAGGAAVQEERMMAMLALTAIHDIMKVEVLLPTVLPEHAPFCGFAAGDMINDHDIALGYVLQVGMIGVHLRMLCVDLRPLIHAVLRS